MLSSTILAHVLLFASFFPEVEDPWPDRIGLNFLFEAAGGCGLLMNLMYAEASEASRNSAVRWGGLWGFRVGAGFYTVSLMVQLLFQS